MWPLDKPRFNYCPALLWNPKTRAYTITPHCFTNLETAKAHFKGTSEVVVRLITERGLMLFEEPHDLDNWQRADLTKGSPIE